MNTILINGVRIEAPPGSNVTVINNQVYIDGQPTNPAHRIEGVGLTIDVNQVPITVHCDRDVTVNGNVSGGVVANGSVRCGNVSGGVEADGDVVCQNVTGGIEGRDVQCSGHVTGGIEARTFRK